MDLIVVGPGRAGGSLCLAAPGAGHHLVGVLSRSGSDRFGPALDPEAPLPGADLLLITVRDHDIAATAAGLVGRCRAVAVAAHLSGFTPVAVLEPLRADGVHIGGFHPLQTLPDPERGAAALAGAHVAIGGEPEAVAALESFGESLGMTPFRIEDGDRPAYHAAAAAAAGFVATALGTAEDLFRSIDVEPAVARPLVERAVENAYAVGAAASLTGPIARGDWDTVAGQVAAAAAVSTRLGLRYRLMAEATALLAGREEEIPRWR